ncbi:uncharacterized protein LY89DRAFT_119489 [Mollisia scopiformis]|uniref:Uncharacterized protein n=1 Tax=Mollisia scopiformis TaxID=149040 RepID=A0A194X3Q9_MOLSC|nr:uncharacterized protein LY89DRAFT_119489 [Mollisia scopiformis]KUJ14679.1 hypothetical protein LY89DRAFT_119489 [Mollisia scopiformis]
MLSEDTDGTELNDIGTPAVPAEVDLMSNPVALNAEEEFAEHPQSGHSPGNLLVEGRSGTEPEMAQQVIQPPISIPGFTPVQIQKIMKEVIDVMIDKLRDLQSDIVQTDLEANNQRRTVSSAQTVSRDCLTVNHPGIVQRQIQEDDYLNGIPSTWQYGVWRNIDEDVIKAIIKQFALELEPTRGYFEPSSKLRSVQFVTIVEAIGSILQTSWQHESELFDIKHLRSYDIYMRITSLIMQHPDKVAKVALEVIKVLSRDMPLRTLTHMCSRKSEELRPIMSGEPSANLEDFFMLFLSFHIVTLGIYKLHKWLSALDHFIDLSRQRGAASDDPFAFLLSTTYADIEEHILKKQRRLEQPWGADLSDDEKIFCSSDLDIHTLTCLKGFEIESTFDVRKHLTMSSNFLKRPQERSWKQILYIYWFPTIWIDKAHYFENFA